MSHTVVGIFDSIHDAQKAFDHLLANGFSHDQVDINENTGDTTTTATTDDRDRKDDGDSISRFFDSLFGSDDADRDRANRYTEVGRRGSIVTVHASSNDKAEQARDILDDYGSVDIDERADQYSQGNYETTSTAATNVDTDQTINVVEEDLEVGKREVETGGVRVRSHIVERPVEENVRLRSEHIHVERNPVNRDATEADLANFKEGTIEMTEHSEKAVVNKEAHVTEEIRVGKTVEEHDEVVKDTVRKTEVDVDDTTNQRTVDVDRDDDATLRDDDTTLRDNPRV